MSLPQFSTESEFARYLGNQFWYVEYRSDGVHWLERTKERERQAEDKRLRSRDGYHITKRDRTILTKEQVEFIAEQRAKNVMWKDILCHLPEVSRKAMMQRYLKHCESYGIQRPTRIAIYQRWPQKLRDEMDAMKAAGGGRKEIADKFGKTVGQIEGYFYWRRRNRP